LQQSQYNEFYEREVLRDAVARWAFPVDKAEIEVAQAIAQLPVFEIRRLPNYKLSEVGMEMGQCHENCRTFAAHDDSWTTVTGWVPDGDVFILHSVIAKAEGALCVTPDVYNRATVNFIPDTEIEWVEEGNRYIAVRNGLRIDAGVRLYPEDKLAECKKLLALINSGHPLNEVRSLMGC
jgi:hypothetical protein